jgi:peptidoglycan/xylan/chitin deacetylase (PgdA/CDA1 family)
MEDMKHPWRANKIILIIIFVFLHSVAFGEVLDKLPTKQKVVSLTFDGCESIAPSYLDEKILSFLIDKKLPFTVFLSGKFARRNKEKISRISCLNFVEIENHSLNHIQHMERLSSKEIRKEVLENERILKEITTKKTRYFRFPGGNYNDQALKCVENIGYKVVFWTFPSGDPDKEVTPKRLKDWVLLKTKPGSILIFHINGRGYATGDALPEIVKELVRKDYTFIKLEEGLSNYAGR